jgi:endoglycosylceramidase
MLLFLLLMFSGAGAAEPAPREGITAQGRRLEDGSGRQVILRGVNAGGRSKLPPFYPFDPAPDFETALARYADGIAALGFNVVRLLVIYEAAEPERGRYDEEYLARYDRMVQAFSRRGIRIIVDAHQDIFSRRLCGDGFPDWTLREQDRERKQDADCKLWSLHYFTGSVEKSFDRFWSDTDRVQESYAEFFGMLARRYAAEPAVIGFEPINEPFPGRWGMLHYSKWYEKQLYPLYEKVAAAVKAADPVELEAAPAEH